ncbi:MAG: CRP-like cAMP-binding protein [Thermoproteota archaeon]|jgi:CRP-like cAMP-binding protein
MKYKIVHELMSQLSPIPEKEWLKFEEIAVYKEAPKNHIILNDGELAEDLYLIMGGSVRMFYRDENGNEFNHSLMFEGSIVAGYPSLVSGTLSKFAIETIEPTVYLSIPYEKFVTFYDGDPAWDKLGRKALELNYLDKLEREAILLTGDAYSKYERVLALYPGIEKRIPQYHIASFIGLTAAGLNRILKKQKEL